MKVLVRAIVVLVVLIASAIGGIALYTAYLGWKTVGSVRVPGQMQLTDAAIYGSGESLILLTSDEVIETAGVNECNVRHSWRHGVSKPLGLWCGGGNIVVVAGLNGECRVFNYLDGSEVARFGSSTSGVIHQWDIAENSDGSVNCIWMSAMDGTLTIWTYSDRNAVHYVLPNNMIVSSLALSGSEVVFAALGRQGVAAMPISKTDVRVEAIAEKSGFTIPEGALHKKSKSADGTLTAYINGN